jgi:hypothetical protein
VEGTSDSLAIKTHFCGDMVEGVMENFGMGFHESLGYNIHLWPKGIL